MMEREIRKVLGKIIRNIEKTQVPGKDDQTVTNFIVPLRPVSNVVLSWLDCSSTK